jgi:hypothetical protein
MEAVGFRVRNGGLMIKSEYGHKLFASLVL